jgi:hypothetical protein
VGRALRKQCLYPEADGVYLAVLRKGLASLKLVWAAAQWRTLCVIKVLNRMGWKLQLIALVLYLSIIIAGFVIIPREPPMFGMGMIPGSLALFSRFGLPMIAALGISVAVFRKSEIRKGINTAFFFVVSIIVWLSAFILFH